ncbi:MAG: hypothetical protein WAX85_02040 [Minisyncoccia bacterium]
MKKTVMTTVRVMEKRPTGQELSRTGMLIESGSEVTFGNPEDCIYDHRVQKALPFEYKGKTYYVIESELDPPLDAPIEINFDQRHRYRFH